MARREVVELAVVRGEGTMPGSGSRTSGPVTICLLDNGDWLVASSPTVPENIATEDIAKELRAKAREYGSKSRAIHKIAKAVEGS
jgi:hypothetical protein